VVDVWLVRVGIGRLFSIVTQILNTRSPCGSTATSAIRNSGITVAWYSANAMQRWISSSSRNEGGVRPHSFFCPPISIGP
jgi:hypothetical protein